MKLLVYTESEAAERYTMEEDIRRIGESEENEGMFRFSSMEQKALYNSLVGKLPDSRLMQSTKPDHLNFIVHQSVLDAITDDINEEPPVMMYRLVLHLADSVATKVQKRYAKLAGRNSQHPVLRAAKTRTLLIKDLRGRMMAWI